MFKAVYDVSQPTHPGYAKFQHLLSDGWIPGRKVDNSDQQYQGFRDNIPYMGIVVMMHPLLRRVYEMFTLSSGETVTANGGSKTKVEGIVVADGDARLRRRTSFDLGFATIFLLALHGFSALKILLIIWMNFQIATKLPRSYVGVTTWIFNIGILFANELCHGYRFATLFSVTGSETALTWGKWMDNHGGLIPRWEVLFNFTVLRLIAFNFDYLWMLDRRASSPAEVRSSFYNSVMQTE